MTRGLKNLETEWGAGTPTEFFLGAAPVRKTIRQRTPGPRALSAIEFVFVDRLVFFISTMPSKVKRPPFFNN